MSVGIGNGGEGWHEFYEHMDRRWDADPSEEDASISRGRTKGMLLANQCITCGFELLVKAGKRL